MSTINLQKIYSVNSVAPGSSHTGVWNNPPANTVLSFFANANPVVPGEGSGTGAVRVSKVTHSHFRDKNSGVDTRHVTIEVINDGTIMTGFDLFMSWVS
jgi:hypothetical protein